MKTLLLLLVTVTSLHGETFYMRPNGSTYGSTNGTSWANAWSGFSDIVWGGGASQLGAGDTLYVGAGTYTQTFTAGASGSSGSPITIRAAQDTHTGTATFNGGTMNFSSRTYVTLDGYYSDSTNFVILGDINGQNANNSIWKYFRMTNGIIDLRFSGANEVGYFYATIAGAPTEEWILNGEASDNGNSYDQTFIHHGYFVVPGRLDDGTGADGMKPGTGFTVTNCILQSVVATVSNAEHQDLIQIYGNHYVKLIGNNFIDSGDAQLGIDNGGATVNNFWIINNTFRRTVDTMGTVMLRIYSSGASIGAFSDVKIDNNTFVDGTRTGSDYGAAIRLHTGDGSTSATSCSMQNNLIYNCGDGWPAILIESITDNWTFQYNLLNAGAAGNTTISGWSQSAGAQSGAPTFVSYTAYTIANNLALASGDTAAKDNGATLGQVAWDINAVARPQGSAWDIGAYEYAGETIPVVSAIDARGTNAVASTNYTITATQSPTSYGVTNLPGGLSLNTGSGVISGTPNEVVTNTVGLFATNAIDTGWTNITWTIVPTPDPPPVTIEAATVNADNVYLR